MKIEHNVNMDVCKLFFKVAALSCQNPLQAAPEPGTGNFHLRTVNRLNFFHKNKNKNILFFVWISYACFYRHFKIYFSSLTYIVMEKIIF